MSSLCCLAACCLLERASLFFLRECFTRPHTFRDSKCLTFVAGLMYLRMTPAPTDGGLPAVLLLAAVWLGERAAVSAVCCLMSTLHTTHTQCAGPPPLHSAVGVELPMKRPLASVTRHTSVTRRQLHDESRDLPRGTRGDTEVPARVIQTGQRAPLSTPTTNRDRDREDSFGTNQLLLYYSMYYCTSCTVLLSL